MNLNQDTSTVNMVHSFKTAITLGTPNSTQTAYLASLVKTKVLKYTRIQGVTGGTDQTSGGCSLC